MEVNSFILLFSEVNSALSFEKEIKKKPLDARNYLINMCLI